MVERSRTDFRHRLAEHANQHAVAAMPPNRAIPTRMHRMKRVPSGSSSVTGLLAV